MFEKRSRGVLSQNLENRDYQNISVAKASGQEALAHASPTPRVPLPGARPLFGQGRVGAGGRNRVCVTVPFGHEEGGGMAGSHRPSLPEHVCESHPMQIRFAQNTRAPRTHRGLDVFLKDGYHAFAIAPDF